MISEAKKRAIKKYRSGLKNISIQVKPELYTQIEAAAKTSGMSLRGFILSAVNDKMSDITNQSASSELLEQDSINEKSEQQESINKET